MDDNSNKVANKNTTSKTMWFRVEVCWRGMSPSAVFSFLKQFQLNINYLQWKPIHSHASATIGPQISEIQTTVKLNWAHKNTC